MFDLGVFSGILAVYGVFFAFTSVIGITLFVLQGLGLFKMSKGFGFRKPWLCFIPIISAFSLGRIGDQYVKNNGKKAKPLKIWLLILSAMNFLLLVGFGVVFIVLIVKFYFDTSDIIVANEELTADIFKILIPIAVFYFLAAFTAIAYTVVYFFALWRVFEIFDNKNAVLYLVLSIFFSFLAPIFIFIIRNNEVKLTPEERLGIHQDG